MIRCPSCGRQGRVCRVEEHAPEGVVAAYICFNRQCSEKGKEIGREVLRPPAGERGDDDNAAGAERAELEHAEKL